MKLKNMEKTNHLCCIIHHSPIIHEYKYQPVIHDRLTENNQTELKMTKNWPIFDQNFSQNWPRFGWPLNYSWNVSFFTSIIPFPIWLTLTTSLHTMGWSLLICAYKINRRVARALTVSQRYSEISNNVTVELSQRTAEAQYSLSS